MELYEKEDVSLYMADLNLIRHYKNNLQEVSLYRHPKLGTVLLINGEIQHVSKWQCYYHESVVHLAAAFIPVIKRALIFGGGDLFAAYEILKYPTIEELIICEWDSDIVDLMKSSYVHAKIVCNNPKVRFMYCDAKHYISTTTSEAFDLIVCDCFNLIEVFPSFDIYTHLNGFLTPDGVCSDLIYRHVFDEYCLTSSLDLLKHQKNKLFSLVTVPEYPGVLHLLSIWGKNKYISQTAKEVVNLVQKSISPESDFFELFNPHYLSFYLYLPTYLKHILKVYK